MCHPLVYRVEHGIYCTCFSFSHYRYCYVGEEICISCTESTILILLPRLCTELEMARGQDCVVDLGSIHFQCEHELRVLPHTYLISNFIIPICLKKGNFLLLLYKAQPLIKGTPNRTIIENLCKQHILKFYIQVSIKFAHNNSTFPKGQNFISPNECMV